MGENVRLRSQIDGKILCDLRNIARTGVRGRDPPRPGVFIKDGKIPLNIMTKRIMQRILSRVPCSKRLQIRIPPMAPCLKFRCDKPLEDTLEAYVF